MIVRIGAGIAVKVNKNMIEGMHNYSKDGFIFPAGMTSGSCFGVVVEGCDVAGGQEDLVPWSWYWWS